jgi:hypothetical protein
MSGTKGFKAPKLSCPKCGQEIAVTHSDPEQYWWRSHKPCGTVKKSKIVYDMLKRDGFLKKGNV